MKINAHLENISKHIRTLVLKHELEYGKKPGYIYLGRNEFEELSAHGNQTSACLPSRDRTFEGIEILRVDKESHIDISCTKFCNSK